VANLQLKAQEPPAQFRRSDPLPKDEGKWSIGAPAVLALILLLAAIARFHSIAGQSLWPDEIFTLQASAGHGLEHQRFTNIGLVVDPADTLALSGRYDTRWWSVATTLARDDNHPPLYFLLIRWWRLLAGSSPGAIRALSALISLLGVWLMYDTVRLSAPMRVAPALWAAALLAVAQPQIQFAQEARAYALLMVLTLGAIAALLRIEQRGASATRLIAMVGCVLGMMFTHYYAIAPAAALGLYVLQRLRSAALRRVTLALAGAAIVYLLVWGPFAWQQHGHIDQNNWWNIDPYPHHVRRTWLNFLLLPFRFLTEPQLSAEPTAAVTGALLYLLPPLLLWWRGRKELLIWWLVLVVPGAMVLILDFARTMRQLEFLRYTITAAPAVYALLALLIPQPTIDSPPRSRRLAWVAHAIPAAALLACLYSLPRAYTETMTPKFDWRIQANFIDRHAQPDDVALVFGTSPRDPGFTGYHYIALRYYSKKLPRTVVFTDQRPGAATLERLRRSSGVVLIIPSETPLPENYLPGFVPGERSDVFGLPRVWRYLPPAAATGTPAAASQPRLEKLPNVHE
jgi:uncharacterized membrane protein